MQLLHNELKQDVGSGKSSASLLECVSTPRYGRGSTDVIPSNTEGSFRAKRYLRMVGRPIIRSISIFIILKVKQGKITFCFVNSLKNIKSQDNIPLLVIENLVLAKLLILIKLLNASGNLQLCKAVSEDFCLLWIQSAKSSLQ